MMEQKLILGAPGCGKTTRLLQIMEEEMANGVRPDRILYSSFTRKAANEAILRACEKFGFKRAQLPYFRTLHSLAFQELHMSREDVMQSRDYKRIGEVLGLQFGWVDFDDGMIVPTANTGDQMLYVIGLSRSKMITLEEAHAECGFEFNWWELKRLADSLVEYKERRGLVDFSDMIDQFTNPINIDVAIIDEAQDLSKQQWAMVERATRNVKRRYIGGDDDQAIFKWSGADVDTFLSLDGEREVLAHSFRLPKAVYNLAQKITKQIGKRYAKSWTPREDEGSVEYVNSIHDINIGEGSCLCLARNKYLLNGVEEFLRSEGYPFINSRGASIDAEAITAIRAWEKLRNGGALPVETIRLCYAYLKVGHGVHRGFKSLRGATGELNITQLVTNWGLMTTAIWHEALVEIEDAEYYLAALRRGEKLHETPRITVSTIHGVKGGEADTVVLLSDVSYKSYEARGDDEHRVFYVGATRARKVLQIVLPQTKYFYEFP